MRLPVTPNRLLLVTGVLVAGIGGGIVFTILLGQLDRSFSTVDQLRDLGLPVLGGISNLGQPPLLHRPRDQGVDRLILNRVHRAGNQLHTIRGHRWPALYRHDDGFVNSTTIVLTKRTGHVKDFQRAAKI